MKTINAQSKQAGTNRTPADKHSEAPLSMNRGRKEVQNLVRNLYSKDRNLQIECVQILCEIGKFEPRLISSFSNEFVSLLDSDDDLLVEAAMTGLSIIAAINPRSVYQSMSRILDKADRGTRLTKEYTLQILLILASENGCSDNAQFFLLRLLACCSAGQFPVFTHQIVPVISQRYLHDFISVLSSRVHELTEKRTKQKIGKLITKLSFLPV